MRLDYIFRQNYMVLTDKGKECLLKAVIDFYDLPDDNLARKYTWCYDLNDEDCLAILQMTVRYAKLWAFA